MSEIIRGAEALARVVDEALDEAASSVVGIGKNAVEDYVLQSAKQIGVRLRVLSVRETKDAYEASWEVESPDGSFALPFQCRKPLFAG